MTNPLTQRAKDNLTKETLTNYLLAIIGGLTIGTMLALAI